MENLVTFALIFLVIFVINVAPAFAPPTWTVLSYIAVTYGGNPILLAAVGAVAATSGRLLLATMSKKLIRGRLLSERTKSNIDVIRTRLEGRRRLTAGLLLFYAFSPLPSNHVFIAYGLTAMELRLIAAPFFVGRLASYSFWALASSSFVRWTGLGADAQSFYFSFYFIVGQALTLLTVCVFAKIDWQRLFSERRIRWLR